MSSLDSEFDSVSVHVSTITEKLQKQKYATSNEKNAESNSKRNEKNTSVNNDKLKKIVASTKSEKRPEVVTTSKTIWEDNEQPVVKTKQHSGNKEKSSDKQKATTRSKEKSDEKPKKDSELKEKSADKTKKHSGNKTKSVDKPKMSSGSREKSADKRKNSAEKPKSASRPISSYRKNDESIKVSQNSKKTEKSKNPNSTNRRRSRSTSEESSNLVRDYVVHELIGEGSFSRVFRVTKRGSPKEQFACKRYKINERTRKWVDRCLTREMDIALRVRHPKIVHTFEAFYHKDEAFLILQLAPNGSVKCQLRLLKEREFLEEEKIRLWFTDMLAAVAYLHGKEIAHRDIKTDNFLFDQAMTPLLCDFSFACFSPSPTVRFDCMVNTQCGTPIYLAPEVHLLRRGDKYNAKKIDVYAMGVCLFELFNKTSPFAGYCFGPKDPRLIEMQTKREYYFRKEVTASFAAIRLMNSMLDPNPNRRISINQALLNDWCKEKNVPRPPHNNGSSEFDFSSQGYSAIVGHDAVDLDSSTDQTGQVNNTANSLSDDVISSSQGASDDGQGCG